MSPALRTFRITTEREYTQDESSAPLRPTARRCDDCAWPDRCKEDRLCWKAEKAAIAAEKNAPPPHVWTQETVIEAIHAWVAEHGRPPAGTKVEWARATDTHPSRQTVIKLFGSWAAGLAAAGHEPLGPYGKARS